MAQKRAKKTSADSNVADWQKVYDLVWEQEDENCDCINCRTARRVMAICRKHLR